MRFACSFAEALAPSWQVYMVFNVIAHLVGTITASASFPLLIESVHSKYRIVQGYAFQYSIGFMASIDRSHFVVVVSKNNNLYRWLDFYLTSLETGERIYFL